MDIHETEKELTIPTHVMDQDLEQSDLNRFKKAMKKNRGIRYGFKIKLTPRQEECLSSKDGLSPQAKPFMPKVIE